MRTKARAIGLLLMFTGVLSILSATGLYLYNQWDEERAAKAAAQTADELAALIIERKSEELPEHTAFDFGDKNEADNGIFLNGVRYIGILIMPAFDLALPVNSEWSYPKLRNSPCRYAGNIYDNTLVIAAHNYRTHFGNISALTKGETVILIDVFGTEHQYSVEHISKIGPLDVYDVVGNGFDLTLFTCTFDGQARAVVKCMRSETSELL